MPAAVKYARSGSVRIAYQVFGSGDVDLILVPGWLSNIDLTWEEPTVARFLTGLATFARVVLVDKRGTGLSDRVADLPTLEVRMDDVRAVMDDAGIESAALYGASEGGAMAALFAATCPERTTALVLGSSFARMTSAPDYPIGRSVQTQRQMMDFVEAHWGEPLGIDERAPSLSKDVRFRQWWARMQRSSASPTAAVTLMRMNAEIDIRSILSAIRVPTLLLHSRNDKVFPIETSRYMADRILGAKLIELSGIDHVPFGDDSPLIMDAIQQFLVGKQGGTDTDRVLATILFIDIADSTKTLEQMGDRRWSDLLKRYQQIARSETMKFRGREIDSVGDGFFAAFDGPARAVRCACAISDSASELGLRLRAGLHTGECEVFGDKLSGIAVHLGARVASMAVPEEVLVSSTVKDLVAGSGIEFASRGTHELKGVSGSWHLYRVDRADARA